MPKAQSITSGTRFARLVVISAGESVKDTRGMNLSTSLCRCDCGVEKTIRNANIKNGAIKSCGCLISETTIKTHTTHGRNTEDPTFACWSAMKSRCNCTDQNHKNWAYYGSRGIKVCHNWQQFENFLADMGEKPIGLSIDRKDNDGNYSCGKCAECSVNGWPMNCRWATASQQRRNQRRCK